jgi:hypothetical protein
LGCRGYALCWSPLDFVTEVQIAAFDISRSSVYKIEARRSYVDDKTLLYLAEMLKKELFPPPTPGSRIFDFMEDWR